ncbi:hypothetical protein QTP70_024279 [Hemibagrus guttatus]|uniref:Guanylate cyclase n=1 Tax=Hemibagrus guttatus TaxID=175788 RepID=A0AAE0UZL9_9TELE|nr:hypothetical protein QTP70_024279 [Hemibagrus guttatus]
MIHTRNVCVNKIQRVHAPCCKVHTLMKFREHCFEIHMIEISGDNKQSVGEQKKSSKLEESMKMLDYEMKKTDDLLYRMIPKPVAKRLRKGEPAVNTCEVFPDVTILFSDVVGFTRICSHITPMQVVSMLNTMYTLFDTLSEKHRVFKVETIGDAYMVVAGAPEKTKYHAHNICDMALDMVRSIDHLKDPSNGNNIQIRVGKGRELADMMERRKVDILCVQETRWKGSKARSIGAGFKLFYYGVDSKRNGVGVVLKEEFVRNVLEVKRVSDRVMSLKLEIEGVMLNVVSGYAPQVGCELEEKERFWSELDEVMERIPTGERVVIGADFNGHVGEGNTGDEEVMGKFGVKERNLEGQMVVDFAKRMDMAVVNTYFQKREEHRVTYKSGGRSTQVHYILCRRGNLKEISDCKVVVGESVARQHRMVVCRMTLMVCKKKRSETEKKTKWWKLKKEECCEEFRQKLRQALGGQVLLPDDWETTAEVIRETGRKVLGVSSGRRKEDKETWWWNEEVQDSIQRKWLAKKKWDMDRTEENRQEYKELQRRVKREVSKAKQKAYDELYTRLDTREGEKDLYRLARQRDRDGKDVQQVRVIKDRDGRVLTSEESVQRRWKEYFEELMNEENEREKRVEGVNSVEQKVDKIRKDEVRKALKRMKSGKAVGPDDIPVEVWKCLGEAAVEFLASLFNRVLEKSTTDAIFALRILMEKYRDGQRELHCVFVDLEKAYDRVPREELWYCMRKSGVAEEYVRVVQDMYERSRTVVRCAVGQTEEFNVEVGLHQGSALSPFLFAIVMDQLSEEVRQESPWTMMFADDIVICSESRQQVEENLERCRFALERRGMKVSRSKTEYMCVNEREGSGTVRLQGEEVKKVQEFKYLGSTVQSNGECGKEVKKRVQAGWNGWRKVSGVLCDRKISARIKGKVYRTVVRPAMLYGLEIVSLRKRQESELEVAELKMLRFSLGVTRLDRIRNEYIRGTAHVGRLGDKVREARLRWFGHVQRRESIHSGMVVAGVVGHKMPRYGLHGDTVHTASAMESNGKEMHIQLSSATYEHLKGSHFIFERRGTITIKGNVEIETYWLKGKRDKDGNAQAACPQFEAQTISKAAISAAEPPIDEEELVFPSVTGEDEDDVKSIRSHRIKMETSGNSLEESMEEGRVEEMSVSKSHYKDALQDGGLQDPHIEMDSPDFDGRDSIMQSPEGSCDSRCSEKSTMCSIS